MKKPISKKAKEKRAARNTIVFSVLLITLMAAGLFLLSKQATQSDIPSTPVNTVNPTIDDISYRVNSFRAVVTDINQNTITAEVLEPEKSGLLKGDLVSIAAAAWNKEDQPELAVGHITEISFDGSFDLTDDEIQIIDGPIALLNVLSVKDCGEYQRVYDDSVSTEGAVSE